MDTLVTLILAIICFACALPGWVLALIAVFFWTAALAFLTAIAAIMTGTGQMIHEYRNWRSRRAVRRALGLSQTFFPPESLT